MGCLEFKCYSMDCFGVFFSMCCSVGCLDFSVVWVVLSSSVIVWIVLDLCFFVCCSVGVLILVLCGLS